MTNDTRHAALIASIAPSVVCETDVHKELKAIPGWFDGLPLLGFTHLDDEVLEQRNCGCGSTLCRFITVEEYEQKRLEGNK